MMGSTSNALSKGGENFKRLFEDSDLKTRNANGQTKSGLYNLFIPMEWNMEGFIDRFGMPVFRKPEKKIRGVDDEWITNGAIDYWEAEVESLKKDADALNEFYRQFPRTESHAFRDESKSSLFNLTKIYQQIDYNDSLIMEHHVTRGRFYWKDGIKDSEVIWTPDSRGRFKVSWTPKKGLNNAKFSKHGVFFPSNEHIGAFGCDSYDISGTVEQIGIKTTRIRALSGEELVCSNADLLGSRVRNYKRMKERRAIFELGVVYQTPHNLLTKIPEIIEKIIENAEFARFDRANFKSFGDSSLLFEIVFYVSAPGNDYNEYMKVQQGINYEIFKKFEELKIDFAYPTQTLHISKE